MSQLLSNLSLGNIQDLLPVYEQYSDYFSITNPIMSGLRMLGGYLLLMLFNICNTAESVYLATFQLLGFSTSKELSPYITIFRVIGWATLVSMLAWLGFKYISGKSINWSTRFTNIMLGIFGLVVIPTLMSIMNSFTISVNTAAAEQPVSTISGSGKGSISFTPIATGVVDLTQFDKDNANKKSYKNWKLTKLNNLDADYYIKNWKYDNYLDDDDVKKLNHPDIFKNKKDEDNSDPGGKKLIVRGLTKHIFFKQTNTAGAYYYRYSLNPWLIIVEFIILTLFFILMGIKIVKLIFELAVTNVIQPFFALSDTSGTKYKVLLNSIMGTYAALASSAALVQVYVIFMSWISQQLGQASSSSKIANLSVTGKGIFFIIAETAAFFAVFSGLGIIEKLTGVEQGLGDEAIQAGVGFGAAAAPVTLAGAGIVKGGKALMARYLGEGSDTDDQEDDTPETNNNETRSNDTNSSNPSLGSSDNSDSSDSQTGSRTTDKPNKDADDEPSGNSDSTPDGQAPIPDSSDSDNQGDSQPDDNRNNDNVASPTPDTGDPETQAAENQGDSQPDNNQDNDNVASPTPDAGDPETQAAENQGDSQPDNNQDNDNVASPTPDAGDPETQAAENQGDSQPDNNQKNDNVASPTPDAGDPETQAAENQGDSQPDNNQKNDDVASPTPDTGDSEEKSNEVGNKNKAVDNQHNPNVVVPPVSSPTSGTQAGSANGAPSESGISSNANPGNSAPETNNQNENVSDPKTNGSDHSSETQESDLSEEESSTGDENPVNQGNPNVATESDGESSTAQSASEDNTTNGTNPTLGPGPQNPNHSGNSKQPQSENASDFDESTDDNSNTNESNNSNDNSDNSSEDESDSQNESKVDRLRAISNASYGVRALNGSSQTIHRGSMPEGNVEGEHDN